MHYPFQVTAYAFGFATHLGGDVATLVDEAAEDGGVLEHSGICSLTGFPGDGARPVRWYTNYGRGR